MSTGKVHRNLAIVQPKIYLYLTRFKFEKSLFTLKIFLRTTTKGHPPHCLPQGANHPRSTPKCSIRKIAMRWDMDYRLRGVKVW